MLGKHFARKAMPKKTCLVGKGQVTPSNTITPRTHLEGTEVPHQFFAELSRWRFSQHLLLSTARGQGSIKGLKFKGHTGGHAANLVPQFEFDIYVSSCSMFLHVPPCSMCIH